MLALVSILSTALPERLSARARRKKEFGLTAVWAVQRQEMREAGRLIRWELHGHLILNKICDVVPTNTVLYYYNDKVR